MASSRSEGPLAPAATEALERLARGAAHDFSNLLFTVLGCTATLVEELPPDSPYHSAVMDAHEAATAARDVVRRLQAFAGQLVVKPDLVVLSDFVDRREPRLQQIVGPGVTIVVTALRSVRAFVDPEHLENVLVELVANAREAMPDGGRIAIDVGPTPDGARITVRDTGVGMDEQTVRHAFEPYFTTRTRERRKGLGLAMVHGTITRSGGRVSVESAPGEGACFELLLPAGPPPCAHG